MPETVGGWIISALGDVAAGWSASTVGAIAIQTTVVAVNYQYQQSQARRQQAAMADMLSRDKQLTTVRATAAVRKLVLGRTRVGGTLLFAFVTGDANQYLHLGIDVAGHEIDAIEEVYFGDEALGTLDGSSTSSGGGGFVTTGRYARESTVETVVVTTLPASGAYITLPTDTEQVVSVAPNDASIAIVMADGGESTIFVERVHYTVTGDTPPRLVGASTTHAGRSIVVTVRKRITRPLVRVKKFLGIAAGERDTDLETECSAAGLGADGFTSSDIGRGIARLHVRLEMDQTVFGSVGVPNITCLVRGAKARNWATGASAWTRNAARLVAWYIMRPEGFNAAVADFDADLALTAQNVCDETVTTASGSQARYTLDGVIYPDADPLQTLAMMQTAMAGEVVPVGGTWDVRAGAWDAPAFTLTDDMLTGEAMSVTPARSFDRKFNSVRGKFSDPTIQYNDNDIPPYTSPTYVTQDGGRELWTDVDLPYTTDVEAAQRIHRIYLHRERNPLAFRCTTSMKAYPLRAGQNCYVKATAYGWETLNGGLGKLFHVTRRSMRLDGKIEFTMVETASAIFDWTYDAATVPDPAPDTAWPRWDYVEPVAGVDCSTSGSTYMVDGDGNVVPYALLSWTPPAQTIYSDAVIVVRWKKATDTSYREERVSVGDTGARLRGVAAGDLVSFGVQVLMPNGARSVTVFGSHIASTALPPQGVPASSIETGGNDLQNSDLAFGASGLYTEGYQNGSDPWGVTADSPDPTNRIAGSPSNAWLYQIGTVSTGWQSAIWPTVAVRGGERRGLEALLAPYRCHARVQVAWVDASGAWIRDDYGSDVPANTGGSGLLNDLNEYHVSRWIGDVPAHATSARVRIVKFGTAGASPSIVSFTQPQFRRLAPGATDMPAYASGPTGSVGTTQLEPASATAIIAGSTAPSAIADQGALTCTASSAFAAVRACSVVVSASVSLDLQSNDITGLPPSKYSYGMRIQYSLDGGTTWSFVPAAGGGVEPSSTAGGHILDLATGARRGVSLAIPACIVTLAAGDSALFRAYLSLERGVQAVMQSNFAITVQGIKA